MKPCLHVPPDTKCESGASGIETRPVKQLQRIWRLPKTTRSDAWQGFSFQQLAFRLTFFTLRPPKDGPPWHNGFPTEATAPSEQYRPTYGLFSADDLSALACLPKYN